MELLYSTAKTIIIYMILVNVVMNILGKSTYKKYVGIFTGMILILIVVSPIMQLLNMGDKLYYYMDLNNFAAENKDITKDIANAGKTQKNEIIKNYKDTLNKQIEKVLTRHNFYIVKSDVTVEENYEDKNYGKVLSINLLISDKKLKEEKSIVDKITIEKIKIRDAEKKNEGLPDSAEDLITGKLKQDLGRLFGLDEKNIQIMIQEN